MKSKGEVEQVFKQFKVMAENQFDTKLKILQSDWGGEFQGLSKFLQEYGIIHRVSCPYTPQQNGLAERKHRHVVEMGLALLAQSGLAKSFWDDAFVTAVFIINRLPTPVLHSISPFESLFKTKPNYLELKPFGCLCYPFIRPYNKHKLDFRSAPSTFLGYSSSHKGYKTLLPTGKLIVTRDVVFDESIFPHNTPALNPIPSSPSSDLSPIQIVAPVLSSIPPHTSQLPVSSSSPPNLHRPDTSLTSAAVRSPSAQSESPLPSSSSSTAPLPIDPPSTSLDPVSDVVKPCHQMTTRSKAGIFKPKTFHISLDCIPKSALVALLIPIWKAAMLEEFLALLRNKTWILTKLPPGKNLIGNT